MTPCEPSFSRGPTGLGLQDPGRGSIQGKWPWMIRAHRRKGSVNVQSAAACNLQLRPTITTGSKPDQPSSPQPVHRFRVAPAVFEQLAHDRQRNLLQRHISSGSRRGGRATSEFDFVAKSVAIIKVSVARRSPCVCIMSSLPVLWLPPTVHKHACEACWELLRIGPNVPLQAVFPLQVVGNGMKMHRDVLQPNARTGSMLPTRHQECNSSFIMSNFSQAHFLVCVTPFATQPSHILKN